METNLKNHYTSLLDSAKVEESKFKGKTNQLVFARLVVFFSLIYSVYFFWGQVIPVFLAPTLLLVAFIYTIKIHAKFLDLRDFQRALITLYSNELKSLDNDFSFAKNGKQFKNSDHEYSHDIDLFGDRSFFQRLNRTATIGGEELLANILTSNDISNIKEKQDALKELSQKETWRHHYLAKALTNSSEVAADKLVNWFKDHKQIVPSGMKILLIIFPLLSLTAFILLSLNIINATIFSAWFILGLLISGGFIKKITKFNSEINNISDTITINGKLLKDIEKEEFTSSILKDIQNKNNATDHNSSEIVLELKKKVDFFNNRNNLLVGIFGNALLLWDLQSAMRLDKWIADYKDKIGFWFDSVYAFDAQISLANYYFNHSNYIFPTVEKDAKPIIKASNLGHPLLDPNVRIDNNVTIDQDNFLIITGANMAGKSTFLRTISLSIVMSNCGLPVCAESFNYTPTRLITSMRTTDSLLDDESYFFSELKRLKFIINALQKEKYFIILDEILKGTNSKDKEEGSKKFVKNLVRLSSSGIIATHDLGLCEIDKELPQIKNFYFDAEIINNELHFDYTMKNGICQNMNASFLLEKMGLV